MADINGTVGNNILLGNAQGQSDTIQGGRGDDVLNGYSGNDYLGGGRGNDILIGGSGSDVMSGGLDADVFRFSAGHIQNGAIDWITDFSFNQHDSLDFLSSANGQNIEIMSATATFVSNAEFAGFDLSNSAHARDLILEVRNTGTGAIQRIVLEDSYSHASSGQWAAYLDTLGYHGAIAANLDTVTL
jgi:Ca2+-binding RTX toxin-like protein